MHLRINFEVIHNYVSLATNQKTSKKTGTNNTMTPKTVPKLNVSNGKHLRADVCHVDHLNWPARPLCETGTQCRQCNRNRRASPRARVFRHLARTPMYPAGTPRRVVSCEARAHQGRAALSRTAAAERNPNDRLSESPMRCVLRLGTAGAQHQAFSFLFFS